MRVVGCINQPDTTTRILDHLRRSITSRPSPRPHPGLRCPPFPPDASLVERQHTARVRSQIQDPRFRLVRCRRRRAVGLSWPKAGQRESLQAHKPRPSPRGSSPEIQPPIPPIPAVLAELIAGSPLRTSVHLILCYTDFRACFAGVSVNDKANITLRLDAELLREARVLAAQLGTSVSRLLATQIEELIRRRKAYDGAHRRALSRLRHGWDLGWSPPRARDELHER